MNSQRHERVSLFREATTVHGESESEKSSPGSSRSRLISPEASDSMRHNYKPVILRTIPLLLFLLYTGTLIGLLEYVARKLPHGEGRSELVPRSPFGDELEELRIIARQISNASSAAEATSTRGQIAQSNFLATVTTSTSTATDMVTSQPARTDTTSTITTSSTTSDSPTLSMNTDDFVTTKTTYASEAQSDYLTTKGTTTYRSADRSDYVPTTATATLVVPSSDYVPTLATATPPAPSAAPSNYVSTIASSAAPTDYVSTQETDGLSAVPLTTTMTTISTSSRAVTTFEKSSQTAGLTESVPSSDYLRTLTTSYELVPLTVTRTTVLPASTSSPEQNEANDDDSSQSVNHTVVSKIWNDTDIFIGTFCAVLLAVIYRILFSVLNSNLCLIDPFRQMMEPQGALAERALFSFYHNASVLLGPIPALRKKRWAVGIPATAYLVACVLPALASEVIWIDTNWGCPNPGANPKIPCPPRLTTTIVVIRILQGLLSFTGAVILGLGVVLLLGRTGLPADPSSMSTVASLMQHPGLSEELNEMPVGPETSLYSMKQALAGRKYGLGSWTTSAGAQGYGIHPLGLDTDVVRLDGSPFASNRGSYSAVNAASSWDETSSKTHTWLWMDPILLFVAVGTFGVVLAWRFTSGDNGFNGFFGSDTFGPRFILTGAATVIANMWGTIEQSAMIMAPFVRLSHKPSPARSTICFKPTSTPGLSIWRSIRHGYWFVALATIVTILSEALSIVISGVPYAAGQTYYTWLASEYLTLSILAIMIISSILVILHRRREPKIPVLPETLGGKMVYLNGSRMLGEFDGLENEKQRARGRRISALHKEYEFRPTIRNDGRRSWLVDEADRPQQYESP